MINVGFGVTVLERSKIVGGIDGIGTYTNELSRQFSKLDQQLGVHPFTVGVSKFSKNLYCLKAWDMRKCTNMQDCLMLP